MKSLTSILMTIILGFTAASAFAEGPTLEDSFARLDTNHDGKISLEEFLAAPKAKRFPSKAEEVFKKIDTNHDGFISLEEFKANPPKGAGKP